MTQSLCRRPHALSLGHRRADRRATNRLTLVARFDLREALGFSCGREDLDEMFSAAA